MTLGDRELRQFVRVIMPELYKIQATWDEWTDATARLSSSVTCHEGSRGAVSERSEELRREHS